MATTASSYSSSLPPQPDSNCSIASKDAVTWEEKNRREQDHVWGKTKSSCVGCWSGCVSHFDFLQDDQIIGAEDDGNDDDRNRNSPFKNVLSRFLKHAPTVPKKLNFRLQVEIDLDRKKYSIDGGDDVQREYGTWKVYNVKAMGDSILAPLAQHPDIQLPTVPVMSHKSAFDSGIILRTMKRKFVVIEVGFWNEDMRRTVVASYTNLSPTSKEQPKELITDRLMKLSLIQQKYLGTAEETLKLQGKASGKGEGYVGQSQSLEERVMVFESDDYEDLIDDGYLNIMPENTDDEAMTKLTSDMPFLSSHGEESKVGISDTVRNAVPVKVESLDLITYDREVKDNLRKEEKDYIQLSVLQHLKNELKKTQNDINDDNTHAFSAMTQTGVFTSLPKTLTKGRDIEKFYFAVQYSDGTLQVVEVEYSMKPIIEARMIKVYSFMDTSATNSN